jgi:RimJ/RimL family protein N-acetyltransferase
MPSRFLLETERLRLRSWRLSDPSRYNQACNTPAVMHWLGGVQSRWEVFRDVKYFIKSEARHGVTFWVVQRASDGMFLGFCGLIRIPDRDCPFRNELEIGWRIREDCWRRGYGFEAAKAVLDYAFSHLDAARIVSRTAGGNVASRKLMRKLGMSRRRDLEYRPRSESAKLAVFCITAKQWQRGRRQR